MDFGIGYRWRSHESNLLLSVRLPSDGSGADTTSSTPATEPAPPKPPRSRAPRPPAPVGHSRSFWFSR
jgi:hypothetical protein